MTSSVVQLVLLVLAVGATTVDFRMRGVWLSVAVGLIAIAIAIPVGLSL